MLFLNKSLIPVIRNIIVIISIEIAKKLAIRKCNGMLEKYIKFTVPKNICPNKNIRIFMNIEKMMIVLSSFLISSI